MSPPHPSEARLRRRKASSPTLRLWVEDRPRGAGEDTCLEYLESLRQVNFSAVALHTIAIISWFWPPRRLYGAGRFLRDGRRGRSSGLGTPPGRWRRASPTDLIYDLSPTLECRNDAFLVNMLEIPTTYFLLTDQSYRPLAAQMMLMMLT